MGIDYGFRKDIIMYTKDTKIGEIAVNPNAAGVFAKHGLGCLGCMLANFETIGEGCAAHGIDVNAILRDLNALDAE